MRFTSSVAAALAVCFTAVTAIPNKRNFELASTKVSIDQHREKLDNGEIIVRVQRTDDLFSDATASQEAKLLLEKNTHILLRVQLDTGSGKVNVNDEPLDILSHQEATVSGIKVETITLPNDHTSPVVDAEVLALVDQLSLGIAKIEVKVESEPVTPSIGMATFTEGEAAPSIEALTVRRVGLWIRITEIEGKEVSHTTALYTPILQLVVTSSGNKVNKIATLAIDGKPPVETGHSMPGPVMGMALPGKEEHQSGHPHPRVHHDRPPLGFFGRLAEFFGLRSGPDRHGRHGPGGRGRSGCRKVREKMAKEHAEGNVFHGKDEHDRLATHRPMLENPFSDLMDDYGGYSSDSGHSGELNVEHDAHSSEEDKQIKHHLKPEYPGAGLPGFGGAPVGVHNRPHHRHSHGHAHGHAGKHGRCGGFFHGIAFAFVHGLAFIGSFFIHPLTMFATSVLIAGALVFHATKKILESRRGAGAGGAVQLGEEQEHLLFDKEKEAGLEQVIVEDAEHLPRYEDRD